MRKTYLFGGRLYKAMDNLTWAAVELLATALVWTDDDDCFCLIECLKYIGVQCALLL